MRTSRCWVFSAAISEAIANEVGLLFIHSPPGPGYPIGFSDVDVRSVAALAETIGPILPGPFAAAVVHPEGWAAGIVEDGVLVPIPSIVSVGRTLRLLSPLRVADREGDSDIAGVDDRQRDALGTVHDYLRQLHMAVVGMGRLGSPIAEQLVRMGTGVVTIVDGDTLDTPSNIRRVTGSTTADLRATAPL